LTEDGVESALEMSKRGGHLWIFLAVPLLARKCRVYIYDLAQKLGVPVKGSGLAEGIEVFPKHDEIQEEAFGNAIAATAVYGNTFNGALSLKALTYFSDGDLPSLSPPVQAKLRELAAEVNLKEIPRMQSKPGMSPSGGVPR
jgi:hypothetical protein